MSAAGATLFSFAVALLHFALELVFFQTMTLLSALQPMVVAGEQAHCDRYSANTAPTWPLQQCLIGSTALQISSVVLHMQPFLVSGWGQAGTITQTSLQNQSESCLVARSKSLH